MAAEANPLVFKRVMPELDLMLFPRHAITEILRLASARKA